jgi:hypothetical protein
MSAIEVMTGAQDLPATAKRKYSPIFLGIFTAFLLASAAMFITLGIVTAKATPFDWLSYWSSAHQMVQHADPYDRPAARAIEDFMGLHSKWGPMITRNPPSALFLMFPLGYMSAEHASVVWRFLLLACLALSVHNIWIAFGKPRTQWHWVAYCFMPALTTVALGQSTIFALLGFSLFLRFYSTRPYLAGAALSLCAIKPHLFIPFGIALLGWILARRAYTIIVGAAASLLLESLFPLIFDPLVWQHYRNMITSDRIEEQFLPCIGVLLRFAVNRHAMWVEFIPAAVAGLWAAWYFYRNRDSWDWKTHGTLLLLVSVVATPYLWMADYALLLPGILVALYVQPRAISILLAMMSAATIQTLHGAAANSPFYLWHSIAWLAWFLYCMKDRLLTQPVVREMQASLCRRQLRFEL